MTPDKNIFIVGAIMLIVGVTIGVFSAPHLITNYLLSESPAESKNSSVGLKIIYPNGGEKLCIGDSIKIKWEQKGLRSVNVGLEINGSTGYPLESVPAEDNEYDWKVGQGVGFIMPEGKGYEVVLMGRAADEQLKPIIARSEKLFSLARCDNTDAFSPPPIKPPLAPPIAFAGRPWGPEQATGFPDSPMLVGGDYRTAWASRTEDDQDEWLLLSYGKNILTKAVIVYESFNPGALDEIDMIQGENAVQLWQRDARPAASFPGEGYVINRIDLQDLILIKQIRLSLKSTKVPGWNEIDAVGLEDENGDVHWATYAQASSWFGESDSGI